VPAALPLLFPSVWSTAGVPDGPSMVTEEVVQSQCISRSMVLGAVVSPSE
jgi:hypothetical protein